VDVVRDDHVLAHVRRDQDDAGNHLLDALDIVDSELDLNPGLFAAGLFAGGTGKDANLVCSELGENLLARVAKTCSVGEQQDDRCDPPGHTDYGDGGAAAVVPHGADRLSEDVFQH
jgi:hypothetical protein